MAVAGVEAGTGAEAEAKAGSGAEVEVKTGTVAGAGTEAAGDARRGAGVEAGTGAGIVAELSQLTLDPELRLELKLEAVLAGFPVACFLANLGGSLEV